MTRTPSTFSSVTRDGSNTDKGPVQLLEFPSQSSINSFTSLSSSIVSSLSPMTVEQAISLLTKPIPVNINVKKEIKEWLASNRFTNKFFASNILNIKGNHLTNIFAQPRDFILESRILFY
ncbi:hypothetical protein GCK72_022685 [Caenorhabditis remanei]|uniref:CUT domain-containing protein n=1 Tax=Caenorhabditis remanei TaxID=31234 RepID=A0A6A5FUJ4_CAERE|nr:hypothetical protein GCK72_022685 [Caenorhabditis remanei]KAF1746232.1 hypothetical protein GCK72_022685 [Caenorhabditis remanei]